MYISLLTCTVVYISQVWHDIIVSSYRTLTQEILFIVAKHVMYLPLICATMLPQLYISEHKLFAVSSRKCYVLLMYDVFLFFHLSEVVKRRVDIEYIAMRRIFEWSMLCNVVSMLSTCLAVWNTYEILYRIICLLNCNNMCTCSAVFAAVFFWGGSSSKFGVDQTGVSCRRRVQDGICCYRVGTQKISKSNAKCHLKAVWSALLTTETFEL